MWSILLFETVGCLFIFKDQNPEIELSHFMQQFREELLSFYKLSAPVMSQF
jgi:hypothetical protein